jgi:hypothetical protein
MSKRFSPLWRITTTLCAILALFASVSQPAQAANTAVRISETSALPGLQANVNIALDNSASLRGFGGFDLLIAYDASALTFQEATPDTLISSCGWEYFTYRFGASGNCNGPCPSGFVRILAIAEEFNFDVHPSCFFSGMSGMLATLKFLVTNDPSYNGVSVPISFFWLECSDNNFASTTGDTMYFSHKVYDFPSGNDITGQPGYGGWPGIADSPNCLNLIGAPPDTAMDFYNGGVDIAFVEPIDTRGDLNLNGIANEVADIIIYIDYFLHGLDAFPATGREAAIAASDINADNIVLTYQDLVYLDRIIIGEALPFPKQPVGSTVDANFVLDPTTHMVAVTCSQPLAGAFMLIRGNVTPTFLIPQSGLSRQAYFDGTYTRILILGDFGQPYSDGAWFTYQGTGKLEYVETTDWNNTVITSHITNIASDCGDFDGSGSINISDIVYVIRHIFSGGFVPIDSHAGDVNCDGSCDISDIVYLLAYIFSGGPAPCANCK